MYINGTRHSSCSVGLHLSSIQVSSTFSSSYPPTAATQLIMSSSFEYRQYFVPGWAISRHIIFSHIQFYLGPYATVRPYSYRGREGYLVSAPGQPLTRVCAFFGSSLRILGRLIYVVLKPALEKLVCCLLFIYCLCRLFTMSALQTGYCHTSFQPVHS